MWFKNQNNIFFRRLLLGIALLFAGNIAFSQNSTSSPYSYFGLGELNETSSPVETGIGGGGLSYYGKDFLAVKNPAALAGIDSLKFIFNLGVSSRFSHLKQHAETGFVIKSNLTQLAFGVSVSKHVSTAFSLRPYTNVGYEINTIQQVIGGNQKYIRQRIGSGGLNQLIWTNGVRLSKRLFLGVNTAFIFGNNTHEENLALAADRYAYESEKQLIASGISMNFGMQYHQPLTDKWQLSIGAKYQPKVGVSAKNKITVSNYDVDIYENTLKKGTFDVPETYALGLGVVKNKQLWVGVDYLLEKWKDTKILNQSTRLKDRQRYSVGMNYDANNGYATRFLKKLTYRLGAYYDTGYIKNEQEDIQTIGLTFGVGMPISRGKGMLNLAFDIGQMGTLSNNNVRERFTRVTLQISLFEGWFIKRKYQ